MEIVETFNRKYRTMKKEKEITGKIRTKNWPQEKFYKKGFEKKMKRVITRKMDRSRKYLKKLV